ncbi:MAG TPA: UDP-3-O-(3-hydroxymyristoyl)glucosamine N-acyltransferase [Clostridia bacterium]|nr:UDP-3-O-(3-hydroxymyristoyl)glucosamine N-acyltransferase [Clostridia bacterium]
MKLAGIKDIISDIEIIVDGEFDALGMATSEYKDEKVLSFLADVKFQRSIVENENIKSVIISKETYDSMDLPKDMGVILSSSPKATFYKLHNKLADMDFYWDRFENNIANSAVISDNAVIGDHSISIGENSIIEANVVIHPGTVIGNNAIIRSGSQIGSNGFQFMNNGEIVTSVKTAGRAIIKDNVEIQHNCCVDRGVLGGDTVLNEYVKLDNFVHIAHDDVIGKRTFITAGVKLAGRVVIGNDCWLGVNATITNGITIGDNCKISLGAVVTKSIASNSTVSGNFAIDHEKFINFIKTIR